MKKELFETNVAFRANKKRQILLYKNKNLVIIPEFLAKWLSNFQIITEYTDCKIDHISMGSK